MKYLTPFGRGNLANLDSMRYKCGSFAPTSGGDAWFRSHVDLVSTTRPSFNDSWVTLSQSGTTTKMMATEGSTLSYFPFDGTALSREVHSGAVVLVNPGPGSTEWTISIPRNDPGVSIKPSSGIDPLDRTHGRDSGSRV